MSTAYSREDKWTRVSLYLGISGLTGFVGRKGDVNFQAGQVGKGGYVPREFWADRFVGESGDVFFRQDASYMVTDDGAPRLLTQPGHN